MGALQGGPNRNFGCVGHSVFGPTDNWPVCSLILGKISKIGTNVSDIMAEMHQIRFPLALLQTPLGSLQRSPRSPAVCKRPTLRGWMEKGEGKGREK